MNIVFYSYKKSIHAHINDHELKRLDHSIRSLRDFNNEIPVYLFCDDPAFIPPYFRLNYNVNVLPFVDGFDHNMLSAWSIHRWYNLKYFEQVYTRNQIYGPLLLWVKGKSDILSASAIVAKYHI